MQHFNFLYKDSLFSIALFTFIIALVILLEQARAYFTRKRNKKFLQKFAQNQNAYASSENLDELLKHAKISSLMFLARAYSKIADIEMSIEILKGLLNRPLKDEEKIAVLDLLAENYFSVGYLQKTKDTVKEILRFSPRNVEALLKLLHAYELEKDYSKALETLECLEELEVPEIETIKNYLYLMHLIENKEDAAKILHVSKASLDLKKIALNHLKSHDKNLFWQEIDATERLENVIDLLWDMNIPAFILEKHALLQDIARSQGLLLDHKPCQVFELEVLRALLNSPMKARLTFEYRCKHCKQIFPFESHRCPVCYQLAFMDVVLKISKESYGSGLNARN
ncbi:tetratricopeptide repeat protein [Helicobacter pylori]|uniref:tetratricopeptide repeat protein n=1 Tax=Helicobacter pylori TaxID=210 RepID=UPI0015D9D82B